MTDSNDTPASDGSIGTILGAASAIPLQRDFATYPMEPAPIVTPWTEIHVRKANEQRTALSLRLDFAIEQKEWQAIEPLTASIRNLDASINGFYGR